MASRLDIKEYEYLFRTHYTQLCYFAFDMLGDIDVARDVVSDVFVQILGFVAKFFLILGCIVLLPVFVLVLFVLVALLFGVVVGGAGFLYHGRVAELAAGARNSGLNF